MAIATDRSKLPKGDTRQGVVPTPNSWLVADIVAGMDAHMKTWRALAYGGDGDDRPMSRPGAVMRHSDAAGCARQLAYKISGAEVTNPSTVIDRMNMFWGTIIHEEIDAGLKAAGYGDECFEVPCGFDMPVKTAGTADFRDTTDGHTTVAEYKTQGGYAYKYHVGERGTAQGPAWSAIVQGSLNAVALGADELVIIDVAKELISKGLAESKGIPENERGLGGWHYLRDDPIEVPGGEIHTFPEIAARELERVAIIAEAVKRNMPVPRAIDDPEVPVAARIVDPMHGRWETHNAKGEVVRFGQYWNKGAGCAQYCGYRDRCQADLDAGC